MTQRAARSAIGCATLALLLAACSGGQEPAKTPERTAAEQAAAREQAKQGPLGEQIKALDEAATVDGTVADQAQATRDAAEAQSGDAPATAAPPP